MIPQPTAMCKCEYGALHRRVAQAANVMPILSHQLFDKNYCHQILLFEVYFYMGHAGAQLMNLLEKC